jgi:hypothetical protein
MIVASQATAPTDLPSSQAAPSLPVSEAAHRVLERVMVTLITGPGVLRAHRGRQSAQHRGHHRRALRSQVPGDDASPGERGLHPELAVLEGRLRVVLGLRQGPGVDLGGQAGQIVLTGPGPGRGDQDVIGGGAAIGRELAGPAADGPAIDSDSTVPSASAATTVGCATARRAQPR